MANCGNFPSMSRLPPSRRPSAINRIGQITTVMWNLVSAATTTHRAIIPADHATSWRRERRAWARTRAAS